MRAGWTASLVALLMTACAGSQFSYDNARLVSVGMTDAEVVRLMGEPYSKVAHGGEEMWYGIMRTV